MKGGPDARDEPVATVCRHGAAAGLPRRFPEAAMPLPDLYPVERTMEIIGSSFEKPCDIQPRKRGLV